MMQSITLVTPNHSFGATDTEGRMFLQRRGITTQLEYGNAQHKFFVILRQDLKWELTIEEERHIFTQEQGQSAVEKLIAEKTGQALKFGKEVLAYCYASAGPATVEKDDLFLSPLRYETYSDTVRHFPTNICVVAFENGQFDKPIFDVDYASGPFQTAVAKALQIGFHSCDTKQGDDYCKRRLAWLAGRYLLEQSPQVEMHVAVLARDMETKARIQLR